MACKALLRPSVESTDSHSGVSSDSMTTILCEYWRL